MNLRNIVKQNKFMYRTYLRIKFFKTIKKCKKRKKMNIDEIKSIIEKEYYDRIHEPIDWTNPKKYTEKIQWRKLFLDDKRITEYSDKVLVRDYVKKIIGNDFLIPVIGVWNSFDEIDIESLPNSFVLKTNHGSGTNIIVKDKSHFDRKTAKILMDGWMKTDFGYSHGFELHYSAITRKIYAEELINNIGDDLEDYKFLCFNGKAYFCWVDVDRNGHHRRNVYDLEWNLQPWGQAKENAIKDIPKPQNFDLMVDLAEKLASDFSHVRVDFYNVEGKIYFGEMTFTNGSGYDLITPRKYDGELGRLWEKYRIS
ncbi:ATP-grasp fold amidoligase family protein [Alkalihalobacillus sp. CinArs1]|uniref:ATP-grasp fold amidoligase family protein n=1 Tax=Alkalihalobacillus sp. CinArs1 TaxID=2995314 RepID=UPI0022DD9A27|nr:ATP-grasp fold amidoligase family protein [Alkalihalobacillus sp. CinArs1]